MDVPHAYVHLLATPFTVWHRPSSIPVAPQSPGTVQLTSSRSDCTASQLVTVSSTPQYIAAAAPDVLARAVVGSVYGRMHPALNCRRQ